MCKANGKLYANWYQLNQTKEFLDALSSDIGYPISKLVEIRKGGNAKIQGTWIHPYVAINLAQWLSPKFLIKVSKWICEWRAYSEENENTFKQALTELIPSKKILKEKAIQLKLIEEFKASAEIKTPAGYIDIITEEKIIEIKEVSNWKHAIGQILCYGTFYPNHKKMIYLFGEISEINDKVIIEQICSKFDIYVKFD